MTITDALNVEYFVLVESMFFFDIFARFQSTEFRMKMNSFAFWNLDRIQFRTLEAIGKRPDVMLYSCAGPFQPVQIRTVFLEFSPVSCIFNPTRAGGIVFLGLAFNGRPFNHLWTERPRK